MYRDSINIDVKQIRLSKKPWQSFEIDYKGISGAGERQKSGDGRKTHKTSNPNSRTAIQVLDKLIEINWFVLLFTISPPFAMTFFCE